MSVANANARLPPGVGTWFTLTSIGKPRAVPAHTDEVQAAATLVPVAKCSWHQPLDPLADQVAGRPAEHGFERMIRGDDHALGVDRHDPLRGGLEQRPKRAIVFRLAVRPPRLLHPAVLVEVEIEPGEPPDIAVGVAVGASPGFWIHATVPSGRTIRNVLSHESFVFDVHISSRRARNPGRSSLCTRVTHASGVAGSSGAKPYRDRNRSSQSTWLVAMTQVHEPPGRRFERDAEPLLLLMERRLGASALDRVPGPFGDVANQRDLWSRPDARLEVIGAEGGDHASAFEQRGPDERCDLPRL
jgi:hypothetical protein